MVLVERNPEGAASGVRVSIFLLKVCIRRYGSLAAQASISASPIVKTGMPPFLIQKSNYNLISLLMKKHITLVPHQKLNISAAAFLTDK